MSYRISTKNDTSETRMAIVKTITKHVLHKMASVPWVQGPLRRACNVGMVPKFLWRSLSIKQTFPIQFESTPPFKYSSVPGDAIGSSLFWGRATQFEAETVNIFVRLAKACRCFFDIGANTGIFSLIACAANPHIAVVAFEPVPDIFAHLTNNLRVNGWEGRCVAINEAIADKMGEAYFHVPTGSVPTSGSLNVKGFRGNRGNLLPVRVTTVDKVVETIAKPDLVKVDVEGFEDKVLEGMTNVLREEAPIMIVECLPDGPHKVFEPMLTRLGYHYFHLTNGKLQAMSTIEPDPNEEYRNYLFVPPTKFDWVMN